MARWHFPAPAALDRPLENSYRRTGYSSRRGGRHYGIDIGAPHGSPAEAIRKCEVVDTGNVWGDSYGHSVLVRWRVRRGWRYFFYAHLSGVHVEPGQRLRKGQRVGSIGSTGRSSGPHIHAEYGTSPRWDRNRINPYRKLERARKRELRRSKRGSS